MGNKKIIGATRFQMSDCMKANFSIIKFCIIWSGFADLILGLRLSNERRRYFVTTSLIGWVQA